MKRGTTQGMAQAPGRSLDPVVQPDFCSSFRCNPPTTYCAKCSHAFFFGSAKVNGINYRWEYNPYHGPLFSRSKDGECRWIPSEKHPVWKAFDAWRKIDPRLNPTGLRCAGLDAHKQDPVVLPLNSDNKSERK